MFQGWRIQLKEAEDAMHGGRLEEARRILEQGSLQQYLPGRRLGARVAERMAERAVELASDGELAAAWRQLHAAQDFGGETEQLLARRRELAAETVADLERQVEAGDTAGAARRIEQLEQRYGVRNESLRTLREVVRHLESAHYLSRHGKFNEAEQQLQHASTLRPDLQVVARQKQQCGERRGECRELGARLHRAMSEQKWSEVSTLAEQLLEIAPDYRLARDARKRAWAAVGTRLVDSRRLDATQIWTPSARPAVDSPAPASRPANGDGERPAGLEHSRMLLWVDGVGGYLVCLGDEVLIGQAVPDNQVHIALLGDLSRRHCRIRRQGEGYTIEPLQAVRVEGREIQQKTLLSDGDELELGEGVRLRFRQPHALSATARLELLTHRTQPPCDGILLMAESCVLGPKWQNHVVCRDWTGDVVLYRHQNALYCRAMQPLEIDGRVYDGRGRIRANSHIAGSDFSMSLEELDRCAIQPLR